MTTVHYISLQSSYAKYLCTTVLTADLQRRSNNPNSAYQPSHIQKIWSPLQPPSRRRETGAEIRQTHRHRIDKYLDTLLANQPISDGEATYVLPEDLCFFTSVTFIVKNILALGSQNRRMGYW